MTKKSFQAIARASFWAGPALFVWLMFWPQPYALPIAIALAMPWIAVLLVLNSRGAISLGLEDRAGRDSLSGIFILPSLTLFLRGMLDFTFLDTSRLIILTLVIAAALALVLTRLLPKSPAHWGEWALLTLVTLGYSYGALVQLDTLPDRAVSQIYRATVSGKHIAHGKSWSYYLDLAPWGPDQEKSSARVPAGLYARIQPGMQVCAALHPGFIGMRWYDVDLC
ncbi:MAG: hypothetical protein WDM89_03400 [Rhizomicrobium sp.]